MHELLYSMAWVCTLHSGIMLFTYAQISSSMGRGINRHYQEQTKAFLAPRSVPRSPIGSWEDTFNSTEGHCHGRSPELKTDILGEIG